MNRFTTTTPTQPVQSNNRCNAGCPVDKFPDGIITGLTKSNLVSNSSSFTDDDILYSMTAKYKKTFTPTYIQNNLLQLANPDNYSHLPMGPSNIFIIRHGEKKNNNFVNPTNQNAFYCIDCNGIQRSIELPNFINDLGTNGFPITAIVTANPSMDIVSNYGHLSMRPQQTIMFSSWILNIPLYIFSYANVSQPYDATTAINIFTNPSLRGKNIVVAFEHDNMQSLTNQLVQCYIYFKEGGTIQNLNNSTLYNVSTEDWWQQNTPVSPQYQYPGFEPQQSTPLYHIPYQKYSQYLPYWNINTFDKVYWLSQTNTQHDLTFEFFYENINTCAKKCEILIGLIQYPYVSNDPNWNNLYENDTKCLPP